MSLEFTLPIQILISTSLFRNPFLITYFLSFFGGVVCLVLHKSLLQVFCFVQKTASLSFFIVMMQACTLYDRVLKLTVIKNKTFS